jgi:hypothetical protein
MQHPIGIRDSQAPVNDEDHSTCPEAHGFLSQSYDSLDHLLRNLAHPAQPEAQSTDHGVGVEVTVVGHQEWLVPFSHLFL